MILLTGATGYIGSHIWVELLNKSIPVIGVDNLSNSKIECLDAISQASGQTLKFFHGDIRDSQFLKNIFSEFQISHVIHLAALKDIQDSLVKQDEYFDVNVRGLENLLHVMKEYGCHKMIFSSSAAVYGDHAISPIAEDANKQPNNWYGETKLKAEVILLEESLGLPAINSIALRYFNVAGRHPTGFMGDCSVSKSQSLFDRIESVVRSKQGKLSVFGDSWSTPDGTCIRDYVHVCDIAKGHVAALSLLDEVGGFTPLNLGSGEGKSVKEVLYAFEHVTGRTLPIEIAAKRAGDVAMSYADCTKAKKLMGWTPSSTLLNMCVDQIG